jgi:putative phosphoribosyl transferase
MSPSSAARAVPVQIDTDSARLEGDLVIPPGPSGLVVFAHGSGSSRFSERNRAVARLLEQGGFATLLMDLLTRREEAIDLRTREYRFDIERLGSRVVAAIDWAGGHPRLSALPVACFGASTGAAVIDLNNAAMRRMTAPVQLEIVPGATHLFEEPGTLEQVSALALGWCQRHLQSLTRPT